MFTRTLALAGNSFLECLRQPVYVVLLLLAMIALGLNAALAGYTFEDDTKLMIDLGLSTLFLTGLMLAAFAASSVLTREIENKTVLTVVTKPVPRPLVIMGKYLGVAGAVVMAFWILSAVFMLTVRHKVMMTARDEFDGPVVVFGFLAFFGSLLTAGALNYLYRQTFTSNFAVMLAMGMTLAIAATSLFDREWHSQSPVVEWRPQLVMALVLVLEAVLVLTTVAIAASTRLSQILTLLVCLGTFLIGLVSEYFLGTAAGKSSLAVPLYVLLPNMQYFWQADALSHGSAITWNHVGTVSAYAALMIAAGLSLAVILFQKRDLG